MAVLRNTAKQLALGISKLLPFSLLTKVSGHKQVLPFYHAISDSYLPHINNLYPVKGIKSFLKDLDFLLQYFEPIDFNEFHKRSTADKYKGKPCFLLSFDDGLKEFYDVVAPILLQKGIPAICFLNSDFVDNKDIFYRYKTSLLLDVYKKNKEVFKNKEVDILLNNPKDIAATLLSVNYQNMGVLNRIAKIVHLDFNDYLLEKTPYLTTEQIDSLISKGFQFGAHSIDHPDYQHLGLSEQVRQTIESIEFVCGKFSIEQKIFSFPFTDFNVSKQFFNELKEKGAADFTFGCAGQKKDSVSNNIQRIPFEISNLSAEQILSSELLYYVFKAPFGKNMIYRI